MIEPLRPYLLQQTNSNALSIRRGPWKLLAHKRLGGQQLQTQQATRQVRPRRQRSRCAPGQLYHLGKDPGETNNVYDKHPKIVKELTALLEESKRSGRSAPLRSK